MFLNTEGSKPIYIQIAEWIETEILNGNFAVEEKVNSQYQLAEMFNINPATAAKGLNILADEDILFKKRGLGMFVSPEAKQQIVKKRKEQTLKRLVQEVVLEARYLDVSERELIQMIEQANQKGDEEGT
ncbi:GntR family transcriptional regulator [Salipaludibacillus keqinensis]|uniref:GntR family transcriptional regulator n=1 Tax=Salipaludibacillus keqinensis TaxID=2045207 RepID=A0A323TJC9_9BACI|nr:GntR family transcriptional regulator [Salipaludibacillus keqinensis]PYZ94650.1 GntR family transcriptional regulator [Salipaludibacillus keqinensis]